MKKILIIGTNGMAGHMIFNYFKNLNQMQVFGIVRNNKDEKNVFSLDVSNTSELKHILEENKFNYIVNCIGILNKDAEDNPENAIWYNSFFPHFLEKSTKETPTKLIHISTDCVFSGTKGNYTENDFKDGIGFYAQSKALGEVVNKKDTTIRTSIIGPELNPNGIGLLNWFLNQPEEANLKGFTNAFWTGITTLELAKVIEQIIDQNIVGLIQVTPKNAISKYELLSLFNAVFRKGMLTILEDSNYKVDKSLKSIRTDFVYIVPSYEEMLESQKKWMMANAQLYKHYSL